MKRPVVGFFASQFAAGDPRGAMRLFLAIATELVNRDDIEVVFLGDFVSEASDPVGCTFLRYSAKDRLHFRGETVNAYSLRDEAAAKTHSPLDALIEQQNRRPVKATTFFRWKREIRRIFRKIDRRPSRLTPTPVEEVKAA